MKFRAFAISLSLITMISFGVLAQAQQLSDNVETGDLALQSVTDPQIVADQKFITIQVSKDTSYKVPLMPDESIGNQNLLEAYYNMSEDQRAQFRLLRLDFLKKAARILYTTNYVYGYGSLIGSSFSFVKSKLTREAFNHANKGLTVKEIRQRATQSVLRAIDMKLWSQAPLMITSNEYGLSLAVGLELAGGFRRWSLGGSEEIGIGFAYNKQTRAFIFEIYHHSEDMLHAQTPVGIAAIIFKGGVTMMSREANGETKMISGRSYNPPGVPAYTSVASNAMATGFEFSLGVPTTPFADMMSYTASFKQNTIIRITVSPLLRGYVRLQAGDVVGAFKIVFARFADTFMVVTEQIRRLVIPVRGLSCARVYSGPNILGL